MELLPPVSELDGILSAGIDFVVCSAASWSGAFSSADALSKALLDVLPTRPHPAAKEHDGRRGETCVLTSLPSMEGPIQG